MRDLLATLNQVFEQGRNCVYCSVVETRGSTPQKAGAAMLVFPDGSQVGTLGGGCVEAEVKRQALRTLSEGGVNQPELLSFCLDDNYGWDDGLICGGRMNILADPLANAGSHRDAAKAYYQLFHERAKAGLGCTEAVVADAALAGAPVGSRYLLNESGQLLASLGSDAVPESVRANLTPLERRPKPYHKQGIAYLPVLPRITLLIVGAGHVGQAVAKLAAEVDFDIWVLDDRESYVSAERFPSASRRLTGDIGQTLHQLAQKEIQPNFYGLIVTRGHSHDEEALYHLATTPAGYVGMIGSKRKIKMIYEDLIARGIPKETLEQVHSPLGFAIGSQTVPEIAVSIVAELIAVRNLGSTIASARVQVNV